MILFPLDIYPEVEFLYHLLILFLIWVGTFVLFPTVVVPIYISTNSKQGFPFFHILTNTCISCLLITAILRGAEISHVILMYISLIISGTEHFFVHLWAICMSSLEKCLFRSFAYSLTRLF